MECCCKFNAKEVLSLKPDKQYLEKVLMYGICPKCNNLVAQVYSLRSDNTWDTKTWKKHKAQKVINYLMPDVINKYVSGKMNGTYSNMNWKYGETKEVKIKRKKKIITILKHYSIDFNGVRKEIKH